MCCRYVGGYAVPSRAPESGTYQAIFIYLVHSTLHIKNWQTAHFAGSQSTSFHKKRQTPMQPFGAFNKNKYQQHSYKML